MIADPDSTVLLLYLDAESADEYLPRVLAEVLEGKLGALGSRIGRLLFKLAVEQDMNANILAALAEVDLDTVPCAPILPRFLPLFILRGAEYGSRGV